MRVQDDSLTHHRPSSHGRRLEEGFVKEREEIRRKRSIVAPERSLTAGRPAGRLLDGYPGTPLHGGSRRDTARDRPRAEDLIEAAET